MGSNPTPSAEQVLIRRAKVVAVRYEDFLERYKAEYGAWQAGDGDGLAAVAALRKLVPQVEEPKRQETARFLVGQWEAELSPAATDRMSRATQAASEAEYAEGTVEERIERLEAAIGQIGVIADESANESERMAILALNEPLVMLIGSLRADRA